VLKLDDQDNLAFTVLIGRSHVYLHCPDCGLPGRWRGDGPLANKGPARHHRNSAALPAVVLGDLWEKSAHATVKVTREFYTCDR